MFKYWGIQACVNVVKEQLKGMRKNAKTAFASSVYQKLKKMTKKANVEVSIPWTCDRQTFRNSTPMPGPKSPTFDRQYFFSSSTTCWSNTHFNGLPEAKLLGPLLIPANLQQLNESSQEKLIQHYSLICRNQAVRRRSWSCESASGMLFCVNTMHGLPS